jgi:hypothetical protein
MTLYLTLLPESLKIRANPLLIADAPPLKRE